MAEYQNKDLREYAENGLSQVTDLLNRRNYNSSVAKARQVAERLVRSYADERHISYTTLAETVEQLYSSGAINMTSRDAFHALRLYGNKAAQDGDCSEGDARNAYYYLNNEFQTWKSRNNVNTDRTPVRVDRNRLTAQSGNSSGSGSLSAENDTDTFVESTPVRRRRRPQSASSSRNQRDQKRRRTGSALQSQRRAQDENSLDIYSILKILIPIVILILIIVILVSLFGGGSSSDVTPTVESPTEETTATESPTTEAPTTEAVETTPAVVSYQISGDNVNIRYAENTNRVYTQLNRGTVIGEVQDVEGTNFAQFTLDGQQMVVSKDFIEPVETTGDTDADADATTEGSTETLPESTESSAGT